MDDCCMAWQPWRGGDYGGIREGGGRSGGGGIASTSSSEYGYGSRHIARLTLEAPFVAASEGTKVGVQPLAVGVFGSHGGTAGRPLLLPGSFPSPDSGT